MGKEQRFYCLCSFLSLQLPKKEQVRMKLQLKKPIDFFDLATSGTNIVSDRIVEVS